MIPAGIHDIVASAIPEAMYRPPVSYTHLDVYKRQDEDDINSAAEKNYLCKCLKTRAAALRHREECTSEN